MYDLPWQERPLDDLDDLVDLNLSVYFIRRLQSVFK